MSLVRPWVKSEVKGVLNFGGMGTEKENSTRRRLRGQMKKQHVQCIEVDEDHNALKINDSETSIWCFVSNPGMENFNDGKNPTFASLNNKTITIEDWEFSTLSIACPEWKAKAHCQICILISKFVLFSGERTTTVGKPTELGDGDRDLRAILRTVASPKDLERALILGQSLTDLRDMDGVLMSASGISTVSRLSWSDVDLELLKTPAVMPSAKDEVEPVIASAGGKHPTPAVDAASRRVGALGKVGEESVPPEAMSQHSPGMEYDGDIGEEEDGFHTQAPSAGNVFSQEEMDIRPASQTPSPPPRKRGGGGGGGGGGNNGGSLGEGLIEPIAQQELGSISDSVTLGGGDESTYDDAPLGHGDEIISKKGAAVAAAQPGTEDGEGEGGSSAGGLNATPPRPTATIRGGGGAKRAGGREEQQEEEREEEEEEEGEENRKDSAGSPVPPGLTQLDVFSPTGITSEEQREVDEEEEDGIPSASAAPIAGSAGLAMKGKGKGKGKGRGKTVGEVGGDGLRVSWHDSVPLLGVDNEPATGDEAARRDREESRASATAGQTSASAAGTASSQDNDMAPPSSAEEIISPEQLSGGSSSVGSPSNKQMGLSCLTQKRQGEGSLCHPGSGARAAPRKCDIRSRFGGRVSGPAERRGLGDDDGQRTSRDDAAGDKGAGAVAGAVAGDDEEEPSSLPDTVEMDVAEDGGARRIVPWNDPVSQKAAKFFPAQPLRACLPSERRWDQERPLSDLLVAVDPKWDGKGRPPIVARGHDADPSLARWLDAKRPKRPPPQATVGEWMDKLRTEELKRQRLASAGRDSGDGGNAGGGSSASGWR